MKILRNESPADGNGPAKTTPETPAPVTPQGEPPPMSMIAVTGRKSEREIELETELENERARAEQLAEEKKAREIEVAVARDELHRFKKAVETPKRSKSVLPSLLIGSDEE